MNLIQSIGRTIASMIGGDSRVAPAGEKRGVTLARYDQWIEKFGSTITSGSGTVTPKRSLALSAVWNAVDIISGSIASMPIRLERRDGDKWVSATEHDQYPLLKLRPHAHYSAYDWKKAMISFSLLRGNGYSEIIRGQNGRPTAYRLIHARHVDYMVHENGMLSYYDFDADKVIMPGDMIHITSGISEDGIGGLPRTRLLSETFNVGLQQNEFSNRFLENNAFLGGILSLPVGAKLDKEQKDNIRSDWKKRTGSGNAGEVAVLDRGVEFTAVGMPLKDAELLESKKFQVEEIARVFNLPPHKISSNERSNYNTLESQNKDYVSDTLLPLAKGLEEELILKVFRDEERTTHKIKVDFKGLLTADTAARTNFYRMMRTNGIMTANEVRELEDMNPHEDGDELHIQANMIPVSLLKNFHENDQNGERNGSGIDRERLIGAIRDAQRSQADG